MLPCLQTAALDVRVRNLCYFRIQVAARDAGKFIAQAAVDVGEWAVAYMEKRPGDRAGPGAVNHRPASIRQRRLLFE